jgi:hypothetical protein
MRQVDTHQLNRTLHRHRGTLFRAEETAGAPRWFLVDPPANPAQEPGSGGRATDSSEDELVGLLERLYAHKGGQGR